MLQRICTPPPQSFLPVSWPQLSSEQIKACHSHVSLQVRCILCSTMGSNPKLSLSAHFRVSFWGLHYPIPLHHTFHMTWKCLSWQNLQISFSTLNSSMVLIKDAVCVQVRRDMDRHEAGRTNWNLVVSGCGMLQTAPKARCLQEHFQNSVGFVSGRSTGLSWSAWVAQVLIRIYIHKIHTKRNRCFTTHTCITPLIASCGLCQKTRPILLHVSAFDLGGCRIRPWGCPVHSSVHPPTFLSVHLKGGHWCVSIMQPLPAQYWDRSIKGNITARFRGFQTMRSDSATLTQTLRERETYIHKGTF